MEQVKTSKGAKGVDAEEEEKKVKSYSAKKYEGSVEEKRKKIQYDIIASNYSIYQQRINKT